MSRGEASPPGSERSYRFVLRAYPADYRRAHGAELAHTAHELAGGRWSAREASALAVGGLRTRASVGCRGTMRGAWTSGLAAGLLGAMVLSAVVELVLWWPALAHPVTGPGNVQVIVSAVAIVVLTRTTGWPALVSVTAVQWSILAQPRVIRYGNIGWVTDSVWQHRVDLVTGVGLVVAALVLALFGDRRPAARWSTTLLAAAVAAALVVLSDIDLGFEMLLLVLGLTVVGVVLAPLDPRPALATASFTLLAVVLPLAGRLSYALEPPSLLAALILLVLGSALAAAGWLGDRRLVRRI